MLQPFSSLLVAGSFCWFLASSVWIYPHSLSYFNESIGGPLKGPKYLLGSNVDWGQDLLYLDRCLQDNLSERPIEIYLSGTGPAITRTLLHNRGKRNMASISAIKQSRSAYSRPSLHGLICLDVTHAFIPAIVDGKYSKTLYSHLWLFNPNTKFVSYNMKTIDFHPAVEGGYSHEL